jgi:hypothetical protein
MACVIVYLRTSGSCFSAVSMRVMSAEVLRFADRSDESAAAAQEAIRLHEEKGNIAAAGLLVGSPASAPR